MLVREAPGPVGRAVRVDLLVVAADLELVVADVARVVRRVGVAARGVVVDRSEDLSEAAVVVERRQRAVTQLEPRPVPRAWSRSGPSAGRRPASGCRSSRRAGSAARRSPGRRRRSGPACASGLKLCGFAEIVPVVDCRSEKYTPCSVVDCARFSVSFREYLFSVIVSGNGQPSPESGSVAHDVRRSGDAARRVEDLIP